MAGNNERMIRMTGTEVLGPELHVGIGQKVVLLGIGRKRGAIPGAHFKSK